MKRVLIFSLAYQPFVGGAELAIQEITNRIDAREYSFDMITLRFDRNLPRVEKIGAVMVYRIGFCTAGATISDRSMPFLCKISKVLFPVTSFFKALTLNHTTRYDMVWAMLANQAGFGGLFFKYTHPHVPYLLELQDGNSLEQMRVRRPFLRLLWPLYREIYMRADRIKVISHFIEGQVRRIGFRGSIDSIPNGVDVARFSLAPGRSGGQAATVADEHIANLRARFDIRMGDIILFTASRLVPSRGVDDIIRALVHVPLETKLLIAGDGEDRAALEQLAKNIGVEARVIFAGQIGHADLPVYLKMSHIFVRPSLIEGMGSAFVEAFAAGIPVVATPVGGIPDFLTDGVTGLFCNVHDPESVARAIKKYIDDPALVVRIVGNAKKLVEERYEWDSIARAMREKIFDPLTARV